MYNRHIPTLVMIFLWLTAHFSFAGTFTELPSAFTGLRFCCVAWGDYDHDGDMDLAMAGSTGAAYMTRVYRNDGGTFTDVNAGMTGVSNCSLAWGDYDSDGDLDLALAGFDGTNPVSKIYRNDDGAFTDIEAVLTGISNCALSWGDCDNDGDLDLAMAGASGASAYTKVYRNDGPGKFSDSGASLTGVTNSALAWGDYDNDGDLDLAVAGLAGTVYTNRIYKNDGAGQFTEAGAGLTGLKACSLAWGDYDNDGDLDLAASGATSSGYSSVIYRNDAGKFTDIKAGIDPAFNCTLAWGDCDNDGDLDLALTGWTTTTGRSTKIYQNDGLGKFTNANAALPGLEYSSIAWADCDNDGDLDLALAGYAGSSVYLAKLYTNMASPNAIPNPPSAASASVSGSSVTFSWNVGYDTLTPAPGLSYNLRVGTAPGSDDIFRSAADAVTGLRRLPALGNTQKRMSWTLKGIRPGQYYWSVQSVDTSLAGSAWASEKAVVVPSVKISGYVRAASGSGVQGVTVTPDNAGHPAITDANGYYEIRVVKGWTGGVSPAMALYSFGPSRTTYTNLQSDQSNQNYTATPYPRISGRVKLSGGDGIAGVTLTPSAGGTSATSAADGTYSLPVPPGFSGSVSAAKVFFNFTPANLNFTNVTIDATGQDFTATPYPKICGTVKIPTGAPVAGATLTNGSAGTSATTDENGYYALSVPAGWSGSVTIAKAQHTFNPVSRAYADVKTDQSAQDYTAYPYPRISGTIRTSTGSGAASVSITASNNGPTATTDHTGRYSIAVAPGWSGTVTPSLGLCSFTPTSQTYSGVSADQANQDYAVDRYFTDAAQHAGLREHYIAWGDYDNDGNLDLAIAGTTSAGPVTRIYRNGPIGTFTGINANIVGVSKCSLAWGDSDNDGDLDLALTGLTASGERVARVYRNDGGEFADLNAGLAGVSAGGVAWGDYDNDGYLDLAIAGATSAAGNGTAKVYRNLRSGAFADINAGLPDVTDAALAWSDYDNDGRLDLALAGDTGSGFITRVYRNNADGTFTSAITGLMGLSSCSLAWGDYDSDGNSDLVITGTQGSSFTTRLYRNTGTGSFTDTNTAFAGVTKGSVSWGDIDNDGDLDLALVGQPTSGSVTARLYRNENGQFTEFVALPVYCPPGPIVFGDYDNDDDLDLAVSAEHFQPSAPSVLKFHIFRNDGFAANSVPSAPSGLTLTRTQGTLTFAWAAASDAQTPAQALAYNLRAGTSPGGNDIFSGMADSTTGLRTLPSTGNAQGRLAWTIKATDSPAVFWSVQAIDSSFAASPWAPDYAIAQLPLCVRLPHGSRIETTGIISGVFADCYYVQSGTHPVGIKVIAQVYSLPAGTRVSVTGTLETSPDGERRIVAQAVDQL